MRFIIISDIEGVTGITTYAQAEREQLGRDMLMNDLNAVIEGINSTGEHEIVVYDMHVHGRNIDLSQLPGNVSVLIGKPIDRNVYKCVGGHFDGLFMVGFHSMSDVPGAMLAHSFLCEYRKMSLNGEVLGEVGVEAALAGSLDIPLLFVSGDDMSAAEAKAVDPEVVCVEVKKSLGPEEALCKAPALTRKLLKEGAAEAVSRIGRIAPKKLSRPVTLDVEFYPSKYLDNMRALHPEIFVSDTAVSATDSELLHLWYDYLVMEREMISRGK